MVNSGLLICTIAGTVLAIFWMILYLKYRRAFSQIVDSISAEDYFMADLFFVGFGLMGLVHYKMDTKGSRKKIREVGEVYGAKYAQYHLYVLRGGQFTYGITFFTFMLLLTGILGKMEFVLVGILLSGLMVYYLEENLNSKIRERREELLLDLPNVLSKLTLLVNSGMMLREAWNRIAYSGDSQLYLEMRSTIQEIENGVSEIDAYMHFADRCYVKEIRKFSATLIQNMQKGSAELVHFLSDMADEVWENKKFLAKKRGDAAAQKLMIPMVLIFIGVLILIMVPMLSGMAL